MRCSKCDLEIATTIAYQIVATTRYEQTVTNLDANCAIALFGADRLRRAGHHALIIRQRLDGERETVEFEQIRF